MTAELIDHSPHHPAAAAPLNTARNLVLIDNYDSFTWNVYQYLVLEGATVTVYRNDEVSLDELVAKNPTQLVVSPGPGHPETDSGISRDAIKHFAGKIPILGVCMGEFVASAPTFEQSPPLILWCTSGNAFIQSLEAALT